jgi:YD repeat-containing protein
MRSSIVSILACAFLMSFTGAVGHAQSNPCLHFATGIPYPFPAGFSAQNCEYQLWSFGSWTCAFYSCPPAASIVEVCPTCGTAGGPISLLTGNTFIKETDVRIPGLSNGLTLTRTWNSRWPSTQASSQAGIFGPNWRSTYEERIFMGGDNYIKYARGDGSFWSFSGFSTLYLVAPANTVATLTADSTYTYWILTFQNGEQRIFSYTSGSLLEIIDRNGNATQLSYDGLNRLVTVTDPAGRQLSFNYGGNSSYLVTGLTSNVGLSLSYTYDTQGRLVQVTYPDQTFVTFQYNSNSMITSVADSLGNLIESHTYDSEGRGLTSSRAGGAEAVTLSYPNP